MPATRRHSKAKDSDSESAAFDEYSLMPPTSKGAWLPPLVRQWFVSCRPWSLPVSIVPIAIVAHLLQEGHQVDTLYSVDLVLVFLGVILAHCGGNLVNTYCDFLYQIDRPATAEDRTLVDELMRPVDILYFSTAMMFAAFSVGCYFIFVSDKGGWPVVYFVLAGGFLAYAYSFRPIAFKNRAMGDVCVFLCFGPLLMGGAAQALCGHVPDQIWAYSAPWGLLTCSVLHANNARDMDSDKAAGSSTLAQFLGKRGSFIIFCFQLASAYSVAMAANLHYASDQFAGFRSALFLLIPVPNMIYLIRCFDCEDLKELPQRVAQHNLLFGVSLIAGLVPSMFLARFMIGCLFVLGAINNVIMWSYQVKLVTEKIRNLLPIPTSLCHFSLGASIVLQLVASLAFILGFHCREAAMLMIAFLVPVTVIVHDFWAVEEEPLATSRMIANFHREFDNEFVHFFKNIGILGGLFLYLEVAEQSG